MTDVRDVERATYDTWTPDHRASIGGWDLYAADGFTRRINSATADGTPATDPETWAAVSNWLVERNAAPIVRVTPLLSPHTVRTIKDVWEYEEIDDSAQFSAPASGDYDDGVRLVDVAEPGFFHDINRLNDRRDTSIPAWQRLLSRVRVRAAGLWVPGVAVGLVVESRPYAAVYSVAVEPSERRKGIAGRMMSAAGAWALDRGADTMILQVYLGNAAATSLYESLGYTERYRYSYLQAAPDSAESIYGC
ncbi:MAG: GNAT family N-acetyltransferase [Acidimicrobiia bacterium]|nr:GNAT family N-acetyltransferase [Acidimicrobiia bacterium]